MDLGERVERAQELDFVAIGRAAREVLQMCVVFAIHRHDVVEAIEVVGHELPRFGGQLDALPARCFGGAGVGALAHVISTRTGARDLEAIGETGLFYEVFHHAFGGR